MGRGYGANLGRRTATGTAARPPKRGPHQGGNGAVRAVSSGTVTSPAPFVPRGVMVGEAERHQDAPTLSWHREAIPLTVVCKTACAAVENRLLQPIAMYQKAPQEEVMETATYPWIMRRVDVGYIRVSKEGPEPGPPVAECGMDSERPAGRTIPYGPFHQETDGISYRVAVARFEAGSTLFAPPADLRIPTVVNVRGVGANPARRPPDGRIGYGIPLP